MEQQQVNMHPFEMVQTVDNMQSLLTKNGIDCLEYAKELTDIFFSEKSYDDRMEKTQRLVETINGG